MYTSQRQVTSVQDIAVRAAGYGIPGVVVDGMDLLAVRDAATEAVERARSGEGPTLLETKTYRFAGHSKSDTGGKYRPKEEIAAWQERDPLVTWRRFLIESGIAEPIITLVESEIEREIEDATERSLASAYAESEALAGAYATTPTFQSTHHAASLVGAGVGGRQ
jgi:TPP-dependent pyruvate/acetoin dehydrogenase alpha subunit